MIKLIFHVSFRVKIKTFFSRMEEYCWQNYNYNFLFFSVGGGSISTVIPPTDYYNSSSYPQYSSPYGGYSYGSSGSLLTK